MKILVLLLFLSPDLRFSFEVKGYKTIQECYEAQIKYSGYTTKCVMATVTTIEDLSKIVSDLE
jgi:hypothetical protein